MKNIFVLVALFFTLVAGHSANAARMDNDLQALILSPYYGPASQAAVKAVNDLGEGYVATLGETSTLSFEEKTYYFYLPVIAIKHPLSPAPGVNVGSIVGVMKPVTNSPFPGVEGAYFSPAPTHP